MTILVAMPFWGAPDLLGRAVRSVLAQSERDLCLLVLGDGVEPPIPGIRDSRLVVHATRRNHGNYFARQAMLLASPFGWYAPHDADDWSDPEHLETLQAMGGDAVACATVRWEQAGHPSALHRGRFHIGLYRTERLTAFGGYTASERIGQDSVLLHLLRLTGELRDCHVPTYHRVRRPGSLTTMVESNHRSLARRQVKRRNRDLYIRAHELMAPEAICAYRARILPPQVAEDLARAVDGLTAKLGQAVAA
jgi:glycosyltransferase involved in cell wall biosynthesis